jgi:hypothetical protein
MLSPNPLHRPNITEVLDHPWVRVSADSVVSFLLYYENIIIVPHYDKGRKISARLIV